MFYSHLAFTSIHFSWLLILISSFFLLFLFFISTFWFLFSSFFFLFLFLFFTIFFFIYSLLLFLSFWLIFILFYFLSSFLLFCFYTFLFFFWVLTNIHFASVRPWWTLFSAMLIPLSNQLELLLNVKTFQKIFLDYHLTGMPTNLGALFIQ
jgi:hypothetical protein